MNRVISTSVPICPECGAGMVKRRLMSYKTKHESSVYICYDNPHMYEVVGPGQAENEIKVRKVTVEKVLEGDKRCTLN